MTNLRLFAEFGGVSKSDGEEPIFRSESAVFGAVVK